MKPPTRPGSGAAAAGGVTVALICAVVSLAACPGDEPDQQCIPGESRQCACPDGASGRQLCAADGQSLGECECAEGPEGDGGAATKTDGAAAAPAPPPPATPPPPSIKLGPPAPPAPAATVLTAAPQDDTGVMGVWHFDEGQAETANDRGPNEVHAKVVGATWTEGRFGKALLFNGASSRVVVPGHVGLAPAGPVTIEAWIRPEASREMEIYHGHDGLALGVRGRGAALEVVFRLNVAGSPKLLTSQTPLGLWQWHHVVGAFDGTKMRVFVDGRQDGVLDAPGTVTPVAGCTAPSIGVRCQGSGGWFHGSIDEVRVSSVVRYTADPEGDAAVAEAPTKTGPAASPGPGKGPAKTAGSAPSGGADGGPASKLPPGLRDIAGPAAREVGKILGVQ